MPDDDPISQVVAASREEAGRGVTSRAEFERLKGKYVGRDKGLVPALFAGIRNLPPEERGGFGSRAAIRPPSLRAMPSPSCIALRAAFRGPSA